MAWIRLQCEHPLMGLVGQPEQGPDVSILRGFVHGYEEALRDSGRPSEDKPFQEWIYLRRPDLPRALWYGHALLQEMDGDHARVLAQLKAWVDEFTAGGR